MTETLTIDRIVARTPDDGQGLPARVDRIVHHIADGRLDRALGSTALASEGEWCIPHVALSTAVDLERPDLSLEELLAQASIDAIVAAVDDSDVVHYPRTVDALADLIASASLGRFEHAWAWARIGLIGDANELERQPRDCVLDALALRPADALAAVTRASGKVGVAPLHRLFGRDGWVHLADIVIGAHIGAASLTDTSDLVRGHPTDQPAGSTSAAAIDRASRLVASSRLAAAARESRLRFDGQTSRALAALVVADSEPAMVSRVGFAPLCMTVAQLVEGLLQPHRATPNGLAEEAHGPAEPRSVVRGESEAPHGSKTAPSADRTFVDPLSSPANTDDAARPTTTTTQSQPDDVVPDRSDERAGQPTSHAGLLFLLNVASDAAMPDALLDDAALDGLDPSYLIARLALVLVPMEEDDPALLAFAGLGEKGLRPGWSRKPLPPHVFESIRSYADAWAAAAVARIGGADEDPGVAVAEIVDRTGRIECEQGWIDVYLALADVDIDIRRAGLDLDPGWVPWLGSVVRFRYE
jgi:hypothetical protein